VSGPKVSYAPESPIRAWRIRVNGNAIQSRRRRTFADLMPLPTSSASGAIRTKPATSQQRNQRNHRWWNWSIHESRPVSSSTSGSRTNCLNRAPSPNHSMSCHRWSSARMSAAPSATSTSATRSEPTHVATTSGVEPSLFVRRWSAPESSSACTTSGRSMKAARCSGVPLSSPRTSTSAPLATATGTASGWPNRIGSQMSPFSAAPIAQLSMLPSVARSETQSTAGTIVTRPRARGRTILRARWFTSATVPRRRQSIAVKNPLSRKNTGIRKPWTAYRNRSNPPPSLAPPSCTGQNEGKKASEACRPMPSSMAKPRRASRSCQRRAGPGSGGATS
jgi:hypothetical protein